jgi:hypothetical protein
MLLVRTKTLRAAARLAALMAVVAIAVTAVVVAPFLSDARSMTGLVGSITSLKLNMVNLLRAMMEQIVSLVLSSRMPPDQAEALARPYLSLVLNIAFLFIVCLVIRLLIKEKWDWPQVVSAWGALSFVYIVVIYGGGAPWYLVSLLAIPLISPDSASNRLLFLLCASVGIFLTLFGYTVLVPIT